jgi:hypothetical protein
MARYKPQDHNSLLLPVVLSEQIVPGSFAFALPWLNQPQPPLRRLESRRTPQRDARPTKEEWRSKTAQKKKRKEAGTNNL